MIRIDLNAERALAQLAELAGRMDDMRPVMNDIGELLILSTKERFAAGVSPQGVPWAPKSQVTIDAYLARGDRDDPRPLHGPSGSLSSEIAYEAGSDFVEVGSSLVYAGVMQFGAAQGAFGQTSRGAPIPWGHIPARPFLGLSDQDETDIAAIIVEWITGPLQ